MPIDLGGGGGGASFFGSTLTATASGAISDGDPLILNSDGTVSVPSESSSTVLSPGEKLFVLGDTPDDVRQYDLSTAFDLSTATSTDYTFSNINSVTPVCLRFSNDGLKMFVLYATKVEEYVLSAPFAVTTAQYSTFQNVRPGNTQKYACSGMCFNDDGTVLYITERTDDRVYQFNLSTAFTLTALTLNFSFYIASQDTQPCGITFNDDGTKFYMVGFTNDRVNEYTVSTPYNISTLTFSQFFSVSPTELQPLDVIFKPDGTEMYVVGNQYNRIIQYTLSTAFDISTASYTALIATTSTQTTPTAIAFNLNTVTATTTTLTESNFIGFADGSYSDGAEVTVQVVGAVNSAQSGLAAGLTYYVQGDGTLTTTSGGPEAGYAISSTELVVKGAYSSVTSEPSSGAGGLKFDLSNVSSGQVLMFTSSTTFTPASDIRALVTCVGGGAGGQASITQTANQDLGGGAGGLCQSLVTLTAGVDYAIVIGAGGNGRNTSLLNGGTTTFAGGALTTMAAGGGTGPTGGTALGGNIINNPGGNGTTQNAANSLTGGGGGAIGVLGPGASADSTSALNLGASIDFVPKIFPFFTASSIVRNTNAAAGAVLTTINASGGTMGGEGIYRDGSEIGSHGGAGGTGSGGGGVFATYGGTGGAGGFPGGGGGAIWSANGGTGYVKFRSSGGQGCIVIEVL